MAIAGNDRPAGGLVDEDLTAGAGLLLFGLAADYAFVSHDLGNTTGFPWSIILILYRHGALSGQGRLSSRLSLIGCKVLCIRRGNCLILQSTARICSDPDTCPSGCQAQ
jgi:hypothetical protein